MMNENWPRWLKASIAKHFADQVEGIKQFVEGSVRDTDRDKEYLEVRMSGPIVKPQPNNQYELAVTVNVALTTVPNDKDTYLHHRWLGKVAAAFKNRIPVYRYGKGDQDDQELLDCLELQSPVHENYMGKIDVVLKLEQSTIDAEYTLTLAGE